MLRLGRRATSHRRSGTVEVVCECGEQLCVVDPTLGLAIWRSAPGPGMELAEHRWSISCERCGRCWAGTTHQLDEVTRLAGGSGHATVDVRLAVPPPTPPAALVEPAHANGQHDRRPTASVSGR